MKTGGLTLMIALMTVGVATGCKRSPEPPRAEPATPSAPPAAAITQPEPAAEPPDTDAAPAAVTATIHSDGYPTGTSTLEGAACDFARSFIANDAELFIETCAPRGFGRNQQYDAFLGMVVDEMGKMKRGEQSTEGGPLRIERVYKPRHLSMNGPASAGYAMHNLNDIMFVDVVTPLDNGTEYTNRTLVFQYPDDTWRVMPRPDMFELLSAGLNQESDSTEEWAP